MDFTFDSPIAPTNPINTFAQDFTQPTQAQPPDGLKAIFDTTRESYTSNSTVVYCVKAIDSEVEKLRVTVEKIVLGREIKSEKIERLDNKIEEISRNLHTLGSMVTRLLQFVSQSYEDGYLETP